ncbi:MAG: sialidase family protein [Polyangiaceae bacterium]
MNPAEPSRAIVSTLGELVEGPFGDPTRWDAAYTIAVDDAKRGQGSRWVSNGLEVTTVNRYAVDPLDTRRHFVAYADIGLAKSTDGGRSFRHVLGPEIRWRSNVYDVAFDPSMKGRMWVAAARQHDIPHWTQLRGVAAGTSGRGGVLRSIDGGDHFVSASTGLPDAPAVSLALHEAAPGRSTMWVALWGSGIFRSTDGQTWEAPKPGLDLRENGNVTRVAAASDGSLYASVTAKRGDGGLVHPGAVFRSTDRGANWAKCALEGAKLAFVRYVAVDPEDPTHVVVTAVDRDGAPGGVFESRDACRSGTLVRPASLANGKDVEFFDAGFDGSSRDVWVTTEEHGTFVGHDGFASLAEWSLPFLSTQRVEPGRGTAPGTRFVATFGGGALRVDLAATQATP